MGAIAKVFDDIGKAIESVVKEIVDVVKAAADAFIGAFKALYESTLALAQAIATGNFAAMAENLLKLGAAIVTIAEPELLAVQIGAQVAMKVVQDTIRLAAQVCGFKMKPWMQDVMGMISIGSNFTNFGNAAMAMGLELTANLAGEKGPLQTDWESTHPELPEDDHYKKIHEKSLAYQESHPEEESQSSFAI